MDRIVGSVTDGYGSTAAGMLIEVIRHGRVIASCPATPHPHQPHFQFSLAVEGRFTSKELITEAVAVIARDSYGNRGCLRLDGATQLELIRDHLGAPADVVLDLDFSRDGKARAYLGAGWSNAEATFTWTLNDDSFISFNAPAEPGTYALRFTAGAMICEPKVPRQVLDVFVDTRQIATLLYRDGHAQFNECKFTHEAFSDPHRTTLRFHHPGAVRPSELYDTQDGRCLAFSFKRLTIVRLLEPQ